MFVICYIDKTDSNCKFMTVADYKPVLENTPQYMDIQHIFRENTDLKIKLSKYEANFIKHHNTYGFDLSDLHKQYENTRTHCIYELMGRNTKNTCYKLILMDLATKKLHKVMVSYLDMHCKEIP